MCLVQLKSLRFSCACFCQVPVANIAFSYEIQKPVQESLQSEIYTLPYLADEGKMSERFWLLQNGFTKCKKWCITCVKVMQLFPKGSQKSRMIFKAVSFDKCSDLNLSGLSKEQIEYKSKNGFPALNSLRSRFQ